MLKSIDKAEPGDPWWLWFIAWMGLGALFAFGLLSFLMVGLAGSVLALVLGALMAQGSRSRRGAPGVTAGVSLLLFYVAFLNRDGPGNVCAQTTTSVSCTQETNPLIWIVPGLLLMLTSVIWSLRILRASTRPFHTKHGQSES